ncbi:hypothetical protein EKG40_16960 [Pseudomonas moorei]|nr:hypothetical protein EKG40_16960 [Pseudomonas moorei]
MPWTPTTRRSSPWSSTRRPAPCRPAPKKPLPDQAPTPARCRRQCRRPSACHRPGMDVGPGPIGRRGQSGLRWQAEFTQRNDRCRSGRSGRL